MILLDIPYFMKNKNWYFFNYKKDKYELTKKAPKKAIESYKEFNSITGKNIYYN